MAREWTARQRDAINTRDKTLLVSAAAGSGKTATLTERIIRTILDDGKRENISDMLIVTFTKAAAGELRERITAAVRAAVKERPGDEHLERQLLLLPGARILTIDAFCGEILRANCDRVGVSPAYRIADEAEAELVAGRILNSLILSVLEGEREDIATPRELDILADCLTDTRRQGDLSAVIRTVYQRLLNTEGGVDTLHTLLSAYLIDDEEPIEDCRFVKFIILSAKNMANHYLGVWQDLLREASSFGPRADKHVIMLMADMERFSGLAASESYSEIAELLSAPFPPTVNKLSDEAFPPITRLRREMREDFERAYRRGFSYTESRWRELCKELHSVLSVLSRLVREFNSLFLAEKNRLGVLEYSDVERYTYECLWQNGQPTDIAASQANMYSYVYIDEYQDVNGVQDAIFRAISRPNNRFMVGDIKQSIYCFRSADPGIFASMKTALPPLDSVGDESAASLFMSENFRCDRGVIDFVNLIFDRVFSVLGDSIGYTPADRLVFSKKYEGGEPEYAKPEICLICREDENADEDDGSGEYDLPARVVARKIKHLIESGHLNDGSSVRPCDIAIIMRNARGRDGVYAGELKRLGIPSTADGEKSFFLNGEVLLALCLLNVIDNPTRDIYLAGLLCSPLFSFSADELTVIRRECPGDTVYASLGAYNRAHPEFKKGRAFERFLQRYRAVSEAIPADELLAMLYRDTGLLALSAKRGSKENLLLLYDYARGFESGGNSGLYSFISYLNSLTEAGRSTFDKREPRRDTDAVSIITAHGSKGLEFPIVFFVDADRAFKRRGEDDVRIAYGADFGIGMFLRSPTGLSLVENPVKYAILDYNYKRKIEEEMRVLYVALTRARERLFVVGKARGDADNYLSGLLHSVGKLTDYALLGMKSYMDVIISTAGRTPMNATEFLRGCGDDVPSSAVGEELAEDSFATDGGLLESLLERFSFKYSGEHLTCLPEKISVSRLYPRLLDGEENDGGEEIIAETPEAEATGILPAFISGKDSYESAKRGIATHMLLQFCDLGYLTERGAAAELSRLVERGFISKKNADLVRLGEVELFRKSKLASDMCGAKQIWRELRFNVRLDASEFTSEEERREAYEGQTVLVQGVIDCIYEDGRGDLHLVDYKTDRLTRAELADPELAKEKLSGAHSLQLSYYAQAVEKMFGKRPVSVEVYSLPLGDTVPV